MEGDAALQALNSITCHKSACSSLTEVIDAG